MTIARGFVAIVLHAHLPFVRHPEHERSIEERWLFEALWECYLPLVGLLSRLADRGVVAPITLSVSPPLASMLRDDLLKRRFDDHLIRTERLASRIDVRSSIEASLRPALRSHQARLRAARALWDDLGGDLLGALVAHHNAGRIELMTTTASHAYLPGLLAEPAQVRAQLRLGLRAFEQMTSVRPSGAWLPECAYDPKLLGDLAGAGVRYSVLDTHGVELASPRPPRGVFAPILAPNGVAFFGRDPSSASDVWSRSRGYPGDPLYREFYRDVGFDLPASELADEVGPGGARLWTGLKLHRITGPGPHKEPYDPEAASSRARAHAAHFLDQRAAALAAASASTERSSNRVELSPPLLVAPFDAELFGHWWLEGPAFLERVLEGLDTSGRRAKPVGTEGVGAVTLGGYLERWPEAVIAEPAPSSWGEGGYGAAWTGRASASLVRHIHHTSREVLAAVRRWRSLMIPRGSISAVTDEGERAIAQSIRELLLLQASDWAFMLTRGEVGSYAEGRVRVHAARARRLAQIALTRASAAEIRPEDAAFTRSAMDRDNFLADLTGPSILDAFDDWPMANNRLIR